MLSQGLRRLQTLEVTYKVGMELCRRFHISSLFGLSEVLQQLFPRGA